MAKKSMILKQQAPAKFSSRRYNRCKLCGRPHAYLRDYGVCRICFRELAYKGEIPGVRKSSFSDGRSTGGPRTGRPPRRAPALRPNFCNREFLIWNSGDSDGERS